MFIVSFFIVILCASPLAQSQERVELTEKYLKKLLDASPPSVQQIEASFLQAQRTQFSQEDSLSLRLEGEGQLYRSDEKLLNNFDGGVTRSATTYSLGIVKPTRYGVDFGIKAFGNKATNAFVADAATNGASISLSVDLYRNFLGRQTDNGLKKGRLALKRAELEKKSSIKTFESNIRKLYWALVANSEQRKLLTSLSSIAEKQYRDAVKKRKSGVADDGEVARIHSQWSSRKADLLSLEYRKGEILRSLKEFFPSLNGKKIIIGNYSVPKTVQDVLACTSVIGSYPKAPFQNTLYDEIVDLLDEEQKMERKMTAVYAGPDIKLVGEYSSVGRGFGFNEAREDFYDDSQPRTSVGLQISMPLGGKKKKTKKAIESFNQARYQSEARQNLSKVNAFHAETLKLVQTLREVLKNQKQTNKYLSQSLKFSNKKYKQARIGLQELISEQDAQLRSRLQEIDSNLAIINTLIDYFSIYNDTPCPFNKI